MISQKVLDMSATQDKSATLHMLAVGFLSKYFSRDYEERLISLKENGTRHGRGTHAFFPSRSYHPVSISPSSLHGQHHLRSRGLNALPSDP